MAWLWPRWESMTWKHTDSLHATSPRQSPLVQNYSNGFLGCQRSVVGGLCTQRWDNQCSMLLSAATRWTDRQKLFHRGVVILHDNVTLHTVRMTTQCFEQYGWKVLQHPPHSLEPAPSDFHLFRHPKWSSSEQLFQSDNNVDASWSNSLYTCDTGFFAKGFDSSFSHLHKCLNTDGDFVRSS